MPPPPCDGAGAPARAAPAPRPAPLRETATHAGPGLGPRGAARRHADGDRAVSVGAGSEAVPSAKGNAALHCAAPKPCAGYRTDRAAGKFRRVKNTPSIHQHRTSF